MTENTQALIIFVLFMGAFGCAGQGDYEYAKSKEAKQIKHEAAKDADIAKAQHEGD